MRQFYHFDLFASVCSMAGCTLYNRHRIDMLDGICCSCSALAHTHTHMRCARQKIYFKTPIVWTTTPTSTATPIARRQKYNIRTRKLANFFRFLFGMKCASPFSNLLFFPVSFHFLSSRKWTVIFFVLLFLHFDYEFFFSSSFWFNPCCSALTELKISSISFFVRSSALR